MDRIERYEKIIMAALDVHQLRIELKEKLSIISSNISAKELKTRSFDNESARKSFLIISSKVEIKKCEHVKSSLIYKDVEIYLHCTIDKRGGEAMKNVLSDISDKVVFDN